MSEEIHFNDGDLIPMPKNGLKTGQKITLVKHFPETFTVTFTMRKKPIPLMKDTLNSIIQNLTNARDLIDKIDPNNINISNVIRENEYELKRLEVLSRQLVENIDLTSRNANG